MTETTPRIRVKELRFVRAGDILPNPSNWREHPIEQIEGYKAIVDSIGITDALLTFELEDGRLMFYDGHMRQKVHPDVVYPTIVTDLTKSEAEQALLTHDPLAAMAQANADKLRALMERNNSDRPEIQRMMAELAVRAKLIPPNNADNEWMGMPEFENNTVKIFHSLIIHFETETDMNDFAKLINQTINKVTRFIYYPKQIELNWLSYRVQDES